MMARGYRVLLNLVRFGLAEQKSSNGDPTNTRIEFTTQIFNITENQAISDPQSTELSTLHLSSTNHAQSSSSSRRNE
ncbi:hypothetical protein H0H81_004574 [Sphagnurus paluster]|uniref:Uncharacterized protein n=1 Tax=Sphagnurus paluster TaxID=117069 RepID=A0A9P7GNK7_9AGAR|nr:hypothetical protein H0H81_004574 [Sphagnurus paluster]